MQAKHAIAYDEFPLYFFVFGIYNYKNICLAWDETVDFANILGLQIVPLLYRGIWDNEKVHACFTGKSYQGVRHGLLERRRLFNAATN